MLTGTGRFFSAGPTSREFEAARRAPFLPQLIDTIEASAKPVVAAVNGTAAGRRPGAGARLPLPRGGQGRAPARACPRSSSASSRAPAARSGCRARSASSRRCTLSPTGPSSTPSQGAAGLIDTWPTATWWPRRCAFAKEQVGKPPRRIGEKTIDATLEVPAGLFEKARASIARHPSGPHRAEGGHRRRRGRRDAADRRGHSRASASCSARPRPAPTRGPCSTPSSPSARRPTCPASARHADCATSRRSASSAPARWAPASRWPSSTPASR